MTSGQPQYDIIIDPNYHRTFYFRQVTQSQQKERVPTFYVYRYTDQRDVHSITTPVPVGDPEVAVQPVLTLQANDGLLTYLVCMFLSNV